MKEWDDFKKRIEQEIRKQISPIKERVREWLAKILSNQDLVARIFSPKFIGGLVVLFVAAGFLIGFVATKGVAGGTDGASGAGFFSWFKWFPQKESRMVQIQADGSFIFSNFERPEDFNQWKMIFARTAPSTNYAWEGSWSGQVSFEGGKELAAVTIGDIGKNPKQPTDWTPYGAFQFYAFHPGKTPESLTFMVTDLWGKQYEETLSIPGGIWARFAIPIEKIAGAVNIKKVNQFSISRRQAGVNIDFYFDDLKLLPSGAAGASAGKKFMDYGFDKRKPAWIVFDPQTNSPVVEVPFIVKNETEGLCQLCPVEGGMPFPIGELKDLKSIRIRNSYGEDLPFQVKPLAYWPDRSIRWLGINFETTLKPAEGTGFFLDYGPNVHTFDFSSPLKAEESEDAIRVNTGIMEAVLNKRSFYLFDQISIDQNANGTYEPSEEVSAKAELTLTFQNKEFRTDLDQKTYTVEVEEKGTQRIVVKASAWYQSEEGKRYCQAIVRYYFYQGKSYFKISHTLIYTGYPANPVYAAYKMLKLPENETVDAYGINIPFKSSETGNDQMFFGQSGTDPLGIVVGNETKLFQKDYDTVSLERDAEKLPVQSNFNGWLGLSNGAQGIAASVRNFRENFPKAFQINRSQGKLSIELWPKEAGPMDLSTTSEAEGPDDYARGNAFGLAKTHELLLYFHSGSSEQARVLDVAESFAKPYLVRTNPYWLDATGALGRLFPVDAKYGTQEKMLERLFDWADRHPKHFKWYGMLNFGDTLTWWRNSDEDNNYAEFGWHPIGRWGWYNSEGVGTHTGALLQYARSGEWKYFEYGENLAKHLMDVDTVHYNTIAADKRIRNVLNDRYSQVGAMHRHSGNHWSGRTDEASHTSVVGILLYYYLTGNERALDVAKEIGEYFLGEPFTYIDRPDMAPNRAMSNALWGDILLYQLTWDERYKKAADKIIKIFLKGQQADGSFLENYNPILGTWSGEKHELYMGGYLVGALIAYHELTQDSSVKEMFLRLVRYLAPTEFMGGEILHGIAYAYLITHDPFFMHAADSNLKKIMDHQQFSQDLMMDGLIYEKPIYHRPNAFLSTVPYVFGALEEHFNSQEQPN